MIKLIRDLHTFFKSLPTGIIGDNCFIGRNVRFTNTPRNIFIGNNVSIHENSRLDVKKEGRIIIGNNTTINFNSMIYASKLIKIGNGCMLAPNIYLGDGNHGFSRDKLIREQPEEVKPIIIGNDVWIGINAVILKGVNIADGCVIGAGAVVTHNTEPYGIYAGVPAQKIGERKLNIIDNEPSIINMSQLKDIDIKKGYCRL